jgi:hypothetical protein
MKTNENIYKIDVPYTYINPTVIYDNSQYKIINYTWEDADVAIIKNDDIYTTNSIKIIF